MSNNTITHKSSDPDGKNMSVSGIFSEEEDLKVIESHTEDSGFISGPLPSSSSSRIDSSSSFTADIKDDDAVISMRLDSGIVDNFGLSQQFSSLSLKNPKLNDLDANCCAPTIEEPTKYTWDKYYEQDLNGDTCLHTAIAALPEAAYTLIKMTPHQSFLDTRNDEGQSALHYAVITKQPNLVRMLVVAGALPFTQNMCGDSPLHIAASTGDLHCCRAITEPVTSDEVLQMDLLYTPKRQLCKLDQWNYDGQTCLHLAAYYGHVDVLRHLVRHGADVNAREGKAGYTALHMAIEKGNEQLVHFLLSDCTTLDVDTLTYGGRTVLQLGGLPVSQTFVEILESKGVDSYYESTSDEEDDEEIDQEMEVPSNVYNNNHLMIDANA